MKKLLFLATILVATTVVSYGQKATTTYSKPRGQSYVITDENKGYPILDAISKFDRKQRYYAINASLILKEEMKKKDTQIWYYLVDKKIYKRKRVTPKTN